MIRCLCLFDLGAEQNPSKNWISLLQAISLYCDYEIITHPKKVYRDIIGLEFGENYNGKSNVIKAIVWGLYKEILGGGDPKYLVNIYTDSNQGYVKLYLTIDDKKYLIHRTVKTTKHKDGKISNSYGIKYQSLEFEYDEEVNMDGYSEKKPKRSVKKVETKEASRTLGAGRYWGKPGLPKPKAAPEIGRAHV